MPVDSEKEQPGPNDEDFGAIDVAALMAQVRLEAPSGTIVVRGVVKAVRRYDSRPNIMYGDLQGFDGRSTMSFECPATDAPSLQEHIVLRGTLKAERSETHRGFDFELKGHRIGRWTPHELGIAFASFERKGPKLPLERFLSKGAVKRLVLIGTEKAVGDAKTTFSRDSRQPVETSATKTGLNTLLAIIAEAAPKFDGLCLIRGGSDPNSFAPWNDVRLVAALIDCGKPFYTAVGHWDDYTLADKYADESFANPSDLASACKEAWKVREDDASNKQQLESLSSYNERLKAEFRKEKSSELSKHLALLQNAIEELRKLPANLSRQVAQVPGKEGNASLQGDLSRMMTSAVQGPVADLKQVIYGAQSAMLSVTRQARFHSWTVMLAIFSTGVVLGGLGCLIGVSRVPNVLDRVRTTQQQAAPLSPALPAQGPGRHRLHPSGQANWPQ